MHAIGCPAALRTSHITPHDRAHGHDLLQRLSCLDAKTCDCSRGIARGARRKAILVTAASWIASVLAVGRTVGLE